MKFHVTNEMFSRKVQIYAVTDDGKKALEPLTVTEVDLPEGAMVTTPMLSLNKAEAQNLINSMYEAGLRPQDGSGAIAHIEAVKYHLEDMRKLVFTINEEKQ